MTQIPPKIIRQVFVLLLILLIGSLIFSEMLPYLSGVLGAITFYILLRKLMKRLVHQYNWKPSIAALMLMLGSFVVVMIPLTGFGIMLGNKISEVASNSEKVIDAFKTQVGQLKFKTGIDFNSQIDTESITTWLSESIQSMAGNTFNLFIAIGLMYFMLYFNKVFDALEFGDIIPATIKTFFFGLAIGVVGCFKGFNCSKGTEGVGKAANTAVVLSSLLLFVIDFIAVFVTDIFYDL